MSDRDDRRTLASAEEGTPEIDQNSGELEASLKLFHEINEMLALLVQLAIAEARLAAGDLKRCLILALVAIPVALLAWVGFSVLLSWLAFMASGYGWVGFTTFFAVQFLTLLLIGGLINRYRKSLSLPETRNQFRSILEEARHAKKTGGA